MNSSSMIIYRKFNFQNAPSWKNIVNRSILGGYSWKVIGYMDVLFEWKALVGWIDSGSFAMEWMLNLAMQRRNVYSSIFRRCVTMDSSSNN